MIDLKFKKLHEDAKIPQHATVGSAGLDLVAVTVSDVKHSAFGSHKYLEYDTGLAVEIPIGYVGLLFPRSSVSDTVHIMANSVGVIDSDYRGSIKMRFKKLGHAMPEYRGGDKIGQLVIVPCPRVSIREVTELSDTKRGNGGFGSTDGKEG